MAADRIGHFCRRGFREARTCRYGGNPLPRPKSLNPCALQRQAFTATRREDPTSRWRRSLVARRDRGTGRRRLRRWGKRSRCGPRPTDEHRSETCWLRYFNPHRSIRSPRRESPDGRPCRRPDDLARAHIEAGPVPWACDDSSIQLAFAKGPAHVSALVRQAVHPASDLEHSVWPSVRGDALRAPFWHVRLLAHLESHASPMPFRGHKDGGADQSISAGARGDLGRSEIMPRGFPQFSSGVSA